MPEPRASRRWHFVLIGLIVVATAVFVILRGRPIGNGNGFREGPGKRLDGDAVKASSLLNEALALLENGKYDAAAEKFAVLDKQASDEPAARRNRAIAAVLAIAPETLDKVRNAEKFQSGLARAEEAVAKAVKLEPKSPVTHLLAARLAEHHDDRRRQFDELQTAVDLSAGDPALETEIYVASRASDDLELQKRGSAALRRAADKATDNLWLLTERLVVEATEKDVDIAKTLVQVKHISQPFVEFIQKLRNVDLIDLLNKAEEAVGKQDWTSVTRFARLVSNIFKPEIATKLDQRRVSKHLLEYVVHDFSAAWYEQAKPALSANAAKAESAIDIQFVEASASDQLPPLAGIRDVKIADFDLDGRWDVIVLLNGQLIVFGQRDPASTDHKSTNGSRWVTLCEQVVPNGLSEIVACDLDRDTEDTPADHRFIGQTAPPIVEKLNNAKANPATSNEAAKNESSEKSSSSTSAAPEGAVERAEDADVDLLLFGEDGLQFWRNQFDPATKTRSLQLVEQGEGFQALRDVRAVAPTDLDHDGDLDLIVSSSNGISIWQNNDSREHTKFIDISYRSALPPTDLKATVLLPVDWNFDVQTDVLVTGRYIEKPGWLENISHGRLRWREFPPNYSRLGHCCSLHLMGLQTSPLGWQLLASGDDPLRNQSSTALDAPITKHLLRGDFFKESARPDDGTLAADFDNDGNRELLSWHSESDFVWIDDKLLIPLKDSTRTVTCRVADFDADGDEDVLIVTDQRPIWVRNDGGNKNGWIDLSIRADKDRKPQRDSERVNIHGVGSLIELRAAGLPEVPGRKSHVRVVEGQSTHFGLGAAKQVDAARIVWTNGIPQNILRPRPGEAIAAQQILKGSCPYLYTWDGEQWTFYTDCLWAAPIGLQLADGKLAQAREWEYLKIDGNRLREHKGEYRLMLTEELWEAAYFDQVRLLAVDHPADVEFFSNEKVGPASVAEFHLHPVRRRHTPLSAHDHRGRDVLERIAKRDERYLRPFDRVIKQGLTEEHFIELDLGKLDNPRSVTLFLTGWVFPTDTSINIGISQNPDLSPPKPPAIWVQDDDGTWREAISYIGFPGGKTKTIAVGLSKALGLDKHEGSNREAQSSDVKSQISDVKSEIKNPKSKIKNRVRIVTSMELYWDEVFFTVDEPPLEHKLTELPLLGADLQFRGFSERLPHPDFGPERFDASQITTEPQWPPMGGKFTRYGDVTELITEGDDFFAILGAGDAMTVRFKAVSNDLPSGWKRDFIIHNVGYDKDADLNTVYGQFVEPLPFQAMRGYPDPSGQEYPDSPAHRDYLRRFQTREQSRTQFWR